MAGMFPMFSAWVEVDRRTEPTSRELDRVMDALKHHHPSLSTSPRGYLGAQISVPAEHLAQAASTAIILVSAAYGAPGIACEVLTEAEHYAREGWEVVPDLLSVTDTALALGVSRQAVLQRINAKTLPASKIGRDYAIPRTAVEKLLGRD